MLTSNKAWTRLFVLFLGSGMATDSSAKIFGQWHFDENSGTVAADSVGGNPGSLNGDAAFVSGGIAGNAVSMSKAGNGYVEFGDIFPLTSGDLTIVVWFKMNPGDQQADIVFVTKHEGGSTNGYMFGANTTGGFGQTDKAFLAASSSGWVVLVSSTTVNDGDWHQFAAVYRESGLAELYIDGALEASGPGGPMVASPAPFMVGAVTISGVPAGRWDGLVDELQVYGWALSSGAIQWLFEQPGVELPPYSIGGTVSGLAGSGLVLQNNGGDDLVIGADGDFTFPMPLVDGSGYTVTVLTQPSSLSQTCSVTNSSGTLAGGNVTDIEVTCVTDTFTIGGSVSGLAGVGLMLQNNGGDDLPISVDGDFTFTTPLEDGADYLVTVSNHPSDPVQVCAVFDGDGTLNGNDVTNVSVNCVNEFISSDGFEDL